MQRIITVDEKKAGSQRELYIIKSNLCPGILPFSCYYDGGTTAGIYNCEGYIKLRNVGHISGISALNITEAFLKAMDELREYLFFPEEYVISPDTVFVSEDYEKVRVIIILSDRPLREDRNTETMIRYLKTKTNTLGGDYLERVIAYLDNNPGYPKIMAHIEKLKSDISFFETK